MSAITPKADMLSVRTNVRLVPQTDVEEENPARLTFK